MWNTCVEEANGEVVESYTMLTLSADTHPLMNRMRKPDPKLGPGQQDKRSLMLLEPADFDQWLAHTVEEAKTLMRWTPLEVFVAGVATAQESP